MHRHKEIVYMIKAIVWIWQLNILCFAAGKWNIRKHSIKMFKANSWYKQSSR